MHKRIFLAVFCTLILSVPAYAGTGVIHLNAPNVLGTLKLDNKQLGKIRSAIKKSLATDIIDTEIQCGEERMDCVVRTARQWAYRGDHFREIVVNVHTVGNTTITMRNHKGKWPKVSIK